MVDMLQSISNLDYWLDTWKDDNNGIYGYVVHHHMDALMVISPDTWTQSAALLGHLNLFERTKDKSWLKKAANEGDYLVDNYIMEKHYYRNANYEHKPTKAGAEDTLIHLAYPTIALLRLSKLLKKQNIPYQKYLDVANDCIQNYIIKKCWDGGVFKSRVQKEFILNMASTVISALCLLTSFSDENYIEEYCVPTAEKIMLRQDENGGVPYSEHSPEIILLYTAITMRGLLDLYEYTGDDKYLSSCKKAAGFLTGHIDPETKLFYHTVGKTKRREKVKKYPQWIAGSLVIVHQIKRLEKYGCSFPEANDVLKTVLSYQYATGGIPTFVGFTDIFMPKFYPPEPEKRKWRDVIAIPGWNALAFECLTYLMPKGDLPKPINVFPGRYESTEYTIEEGEHDVIFWKDKDMAAKWIKGREVWAFGTIPLRTGAERIIYNMETLLPILRYVPGFKHFFK